MRSKIVVFGLWFVRQMPSAYSLLSSHYDHSRLKGSVESCHNNPSLNSFWSTLVRPEYPAWDTNMEVLEYNFPSQRNDVLRFQFYGLYSLTPPLNLKGFAIEPFQESRGIEVPTHTRFVSQETASFSSWTNGRQGNKLFPSTSAIIVFQTSFVLSTKKGLNHPKWCIANWCVQYIMPVPYACRLYNMIYIRIYIYMIKYIRT